jgi:hypothetical protein
MADTGYKGQDEERKKSNIKEENPEQKKKKNPRWKETNLKETFVKI